MTEEKNSGGSTRQTRRVKAPCLGKLQGGKVKGNEGGNVGLLASAAGEKTSDKGRVWGKERNHLSQKRKEWGVGQEVEP